MCFHLTSLFLLSPSSKQPSTREALQSLGGQQQQQHQQQQQKFFSSCSPTAGDFLSSSPPPPPSNSNGESAPPPTPGVPTSASSCSSTSRSDGQEQQPVVTTVADSMAPLASSIKLSMGGGGGGSSCCFATQSTGRETARSSDSPLVSAVVASVGDQEPSVSSCDPSVCRPPMGNGGSRVESHGIRVLTPSEIMRTLPSIGNNNASMTGHQNNYGGCGQQLAHHPLPLPQSLHHHHLQQQQLHLHHAAAMATATVLGGTVRETDA